MNKGFDFDAAVHSFARVQEIREERNFVLCDLHVESLKERCLTKYESAMRPFARAVKSLSLYEVTQLHNMRSLNRINKIKAR